MVWLARDSVLDIQVAIKIVDLSEASRPNDQAARLLREARAAAGLRHAGIVKIFDHGETGLGDPYIVMEYLRGQSLADALSDEPRLRPVEAVQLMLPLANAVAAAHDAGVIHRDIKPENVFLARDMSGATRPKLLDFGIAKVRAPTSQLTIDGTLLGTPEYMSPEQARGLTDVGPAADIWALCVMLYELLAGQRPFRGANYNVVLNEICSGTPARLEDQAGIDTKLATIVRDGLVKEPNLRHPSARAFVTRLADWLATAGVDEDMTGRVVSSRRPRVRSAAQPTPSISPVVSTMDTPTVDAAALPAANRKPLWGALAAVASVVVVGVVVVFSLQRGGSQPTPPTNVGASVGRPVPVTEVEVTEPTDAPGAVMKPAPAVSAVPPVPSAEPETAKPETAKPVQTTRAKSRSVTPARKSRRAKKRGESFDFGF